MHRSCGTFAILAHSLSFVKHFFENFFVFFGSACRSNQRFQNQLCYLTTLTGVCQALFSEAQWLSWISTVQIRLVFRSHSLAILAHPGPFVKNFFRKLFKSAISQEALAGLSRRQLWQNTKSRPICQHLFQNFFKKSKNSLYAPGFSGTRGVNWKNHLCKRQLSCYTGTG